MKSKMAEKIRCPTYPCKIRRKAPACFSLVISLALLLFTPNSTAGNTATQYVIGDTTFSYGAGDPNVCLLKINLNGNLQWEKTFGGSELDGGGGNG